MRSAATVTLAVIAGFIAGIVLSEIIAIVGLLVFDRIVGIRYLPVLTALLCAVAVAVWNHRRKQS
jgi:fructose-specific phosphotransferase system IIC component